MTTGTGIIFLQKDKFDFYSPGLVKIIEFRFVPEIVRDLEIINSDLLASLIKLFVENNKIMSSELLLVLADNSCFIKDFIFPVRIQAGNPQIDAQVAPILSSSEDQEKQKEDVKSFIDHIPFENVATRNFPLRNGTKVLAVNKDFYIAVKNAFEKVGFKVSAVYPGVVFQNNIGSKPVMDIISANIIFQQADMVRENNLLKEDKTFQPVVEKVDNDKGEKKDFVVQDFDDKPGKKSNKRLFMMIGIFAVLIIILVVVYIGSQQQPV
ncbi:MAG TPA: hypothetical protein VM077_01310 [Candidatus Limnocylindrales bacterium]|nr:hypothetical protein [Candidatus Limnocylindrales bacterium]